MTDLLVGQDTKYSWKCIRSNPETSRAQLLWFTSRFIAPGNSLNLHSSGFDSQDLGLLYWNPLISSSIFINLRLSLYKVDWGTVERQNYILSKSHIQIQWDLSLPTEIPQPQTWPPHLEIIKAIYGLGRAPIWVLWQTITYHMHWVYHSVFTTWSTHKYREPCVQDSQWDTWNHPHINHLSHHHQPQCNGSLGYLGILYKYKITRPIWFTPDFDFTAENTGTWHVTTWKKQDE